MTTQPVTSPAPAARRRGADHPGPPLGAPAIAFAVTFAAGILVGPISGAGAIPSPYGSAAEVAAYATDHAGTLALGSWLLLLSSVGLLVFSAVAYSRLAFLAPNAPGPVIAGLGGVAASLLLALSAATEWTLSRAPVGDQPELAQALRYLGFVTGGPAHTAALGILVLGLAVTTVFVHRTPRAWSVLGIAIAVVDIASTVALLTETAAPLIPVGRFLSIAWLVVIALLVPRDRAARRTSV